jgi:hypothetical protein
VGAREALLELSNHLMAIWCQLYLGKVKAKYPVSGPRDGRILKDIRGIYDETEIETYMQAFFSMNDPFFEDCGWSLTCFKGCLPKIVAHTTRKLRQAGAESVQDIRVLRAIDRVREDGWDGSDCPHTTPCSSLGICQTLQSVARRA